MAQDTTQDYGAYAQAGADIGAAAINYYGAKEEGEKQRIHDRQMSDYTYSKDLEQWNRQNSYNTPEAQQQRLEDAGLNKNLMYGQGTVGNNSSMVKYNKPSSAHPFMPLKIPQTMSMWQDIKMKEVQTDNLKKIGNIIDETHRTKNMENQLLGYQVGIGIDKYKYDLSAMEQNLKFKQRRVDTEASRQGLTQFQSNWAQKRLEEYNKNKIDINRDPASTRWTGEFFKNVWEWMKDQHNPDNLNNPLEWDILK